MVKHAVSQNCRGCSYLHVKLHLCAKELRVQSHQLSISVMKVALETRVSEQQALNCALFEHSKKNLPF